MQGVLGKNLYISEGFSKSNLIQIINTNHLAINSQHYSVNTAM